MSATVGAAGANLGLVVGWTSPTDYVLLAGWRDFVNYSVIRITAQGSDTLHRVGPVGVQAGDVLTARIRGDRLTLWIGPTAVYDASVDGMATAPTVGLWTGEPDTSFSRFSISEPT